MKRKCPSCESIDIIDGLTVMDRREKSRLPLTLSLEVGSGGLFCSGNADFEAGTKVCADCGYVFFSLSRSDAAALKRADKIRRIFADAPNLKNDPKFQQFLTDEPYRKGHGATEELMGFAEWMEKNFPDESIG